MDTNLQIIKEEVETEEAGIMVVKTENEFEDIYNHKIKPEINLSNLISLNEGSDYIDKELKEDFDSNIDFEETIPEFIIDQIMLKNTRVEDDSESRAYRKDTDKHDLNTSKTFDCDHSDYRTLNKSNLIDQRVETIIQKYHCNICEYKTHCKSCFEVHNLRRHDKSTVKKFNCNHCDYKTNINSNFSRHVLTKHDRSDNKKHNCKLCDYQTFHKYLLNSHILNCHDKDGTKKYSCNHCDYKTNYKLNFNNHMLAKHDNNIVKSYSCDICGYMTNIKRILKRHLVIHDEGAIKKCNHCDFKTRNKTRLNRHVLAKHDKNTIENTKDEMC